MDTNLIEQLKQLEDNNLSSYERLTKLSDYMNKEFTGNRIHDVGYLVTFYNYIKNNDDYKRYSNQYKDAFSKYLNTTYYDKAIVRNDFDELVNNSEDYLNILMELANDELATIIVDVAKEKLDKDVNFLNSYNKIAKAVRENKPNISNLLVEVSSIANPIDKEFDDIRSEINESSLAAQKNIHESQLSNSLNVSSNELPVGNDITIEKVREDLDKKVKESMDKINKMTDDALNDPNLGTSSKPASLDGDNKVSETIDLGTFDRPKVTSSVDYENQMADIESQMKELNMKQKSIQRENEARIDAMAREKAGELNVSSDTLKKYLDKSGISLNNMDSIVISPLMQKQIAANEAIAQLEGNRFANLIRKVFSPLELKHSSLQVEEIDGKKACYIESTDKSQRIANMEGKFLEVIKKNCERKVRLSNMIVNAKEGIKNAIKKVATKMKNKDLDNRKNVSGKLHDLADKIYKEPQTFNDGVYVSNDYYIENPSIEDEIRMLQEHKIDGNAGSLVGQIDNPEMEKSAKTM